MRRVRILLVASVAMLSMFVLLYTLLARTSTPATLGHPGLDAAVRDAFEHQGGRVARIDLERLTELDASGRGIDDLEGIGRMPNLTRLNLSGNRVTDLSPLATLSRLQSLDLGDNNIVDLANVNLEALSQLPELRTLTLRHNRGPSHPERPGEHDRISDLSALGALETLEELDLSDNHIEDVTPLARLVRLRSLDLSKNRLTEDALSALSPLRRLEHLNVRDNNVRDISGLSDLTTLRYLNLHSNTGVESIVPLAGLVSLEELILRNVPVEDDVRVLRELTSLRRLNVRNTGIRDLTVLADLMAEGALQDDTPAGIFAEVDIRENPVAEVGDDSGYRLLAEYWPNIARRHPQELPR